MGLSRTVSEIDGDFGRKSQIFPTSCILRPADRVPLGISALGSKTRMTGATAPTKKFDDIFSRVDTMHQCDRQTDGHRATAKTALTHSVAQ